MSVGLIVGLTPVLKEKAKSREKIIGLLAEDGKLSAVALAGKVGIRAKAVENHLARLKAEGTIERIGPAKNEWWKVIYRNLPCIHG